MARRGRRTFQYVNSKKWNERAVEVEVEKDSDSLVDWIQYRKYRRCMDLFRPSITASKV